MKKLFLILMLVNMAAWGGDWDPIPGAEVWQSTVAITSNGQYFTYESMVQIEHHIHLLESRVKILEGRLDQALDRIKKLECEQKKDDYSIGVTSDGIHYVGGWDHRCKDFK